MSRRAATRLLLVSTLLTAGCARSTLSVFKLVSPGPQAIAGAYTVEPRAEWSSFVDGGRLLTWTIDGAALERLRFFGGIEDGQSLVASAPAATLGPRFVATMTRVEVSEFVADSLFGSVFPPRNARPASFGTAQGFRFEVSYATSDGVKREALVVGAVLERRLYVIAYDGTALHHFDRYRPEVEQILASIRLTGTSAKP